MSSRPSFFRIDLWARREAEVLAVTLSALKALAAQPPPQTDEDSLNWALAGHIREAILTGRRAGATSLEAPALEPKSLSVGPLDEGPAVRDRKRPDLVWTWANEHARIIEQSFLEMVIECKRLGDTELCRLYVANGVVRFKNEEHAYAKHMRSGFMVGYLQNIDSQKAREHVGRVLKNLGLADLGAPVLPGSCFRQDLRRPYPVDPFALNHLWQAIPAP